jgi:hypothetical protein
MRRSIMMLVLGLFLPSDASALSIYPVPDGNKYVPEPVNNFETPRVADFTVAPCCRPPVYPAG